jgi:hypothetical protein
MERDEFFAPKFCAIGEYREQKVNGGVQRHGQSNQYVDRSVKRR